MMLEELFECQNLRTRERKFTYFSLLFGRVRA